MEQLSGDSVSPPTFKATVNDIYISAEKQSKVAGVTLYAGRAEVTREVRLSVVTGQNKVRITELLSSMKGSTMRYVASYFLGVSISSDQALAFRVGGRGAGTIQGVVVSNTPQPSKITTSPTLDAIREKQEEVEAAVQRYKRSQEAVEKYLQTLNAQHVDGATLNGIINSSEENLERLDKKLAGLQKKADALRKEKEQEEARLNPPFNFQLRKQVEIDLFVEKNGEVSLALRYGKCRQS